MTANEMSADWQTIRFLEESADWNDAKGAVELARHLRIAANRMRSAINTHSKELLNA